MASSRMADTVFNALEQIKIAAEQSACMSEYSNFPVKRYGLEKSTEKAAELKSSGNKHYQQKNFEAARQCFLEALFITPWAEQPFKQVTEKLNPALKSGQTVANVTSSSSLLSVCYGNLSATYYELNRFKDALACIKEALLLDYLASSSTAVTCAKLYRRRIFCLAQLGRQREAESEFYNYTQLIKNLALSDEKKDTNTEVETVREKMKACLVNRTPLDRIAAEINEEEEDVSSYTSQVSRSICMHRTAEKGRHILARKKIGFGKQLVCEKAYVAVLNASKYLYSHCSNCLKRCSLLRPCPLCPNAGYCCEECRFEAWKKYHWLECRVSTWRKVDYLMWVGPRMLLSAPRDEIRQLLLDSVETSASVCMEKACTDPSYMPFYSAPLSLVTHAGDQDLPSSAKNVSSAMVADMGDTIVCHYDLDKYNAIVMELLERLIYRHLLQLRCNSHTISFLDYEGDSKGGCESLLSMSHEKLGVGVYLTANLFNHACEPNTALRFTNNWLIISASNDVPRGAELNHTYGPQLGKQTRSERQVLLKNNYHFRCRCNVCYKPTKETKFRDYAWHSYACPKCKGALPGPSNKDDLSSTCIECGETSKLHDMSKKERKADLLFIDIRLGGDELANLLEAERLYSEGLHKYNKKLSSTRDAIGQYYANKKIMHKVVKYCLMSCDTIIHIHGLRTIEAAMELFKIAQMYGYMKRYRDSYSTAMKILPITELHLGPNHTQVIELRFIIALAKEHM